MIFDLYSKRLKREKGDLPDIFVYDKIPPKLKVQILHIITDAIGEDIYSSETAVANVYKFIHQTLCREYGLFFLVKNCSDESAIRNFFLNTTKIEEELDIIELCFRYIDKIIREDLNYLHNVQNRNISPDDAISELNERFKENGVGYSFDSGQIIRIDSTYTHSEITKPALNLLWNKIFENANEEFLKAHEHYLHGRNKECLTECLKSIESVLKIICSNKNWAFDQKDTAKRLIQICFDNNLIPSYLQTQFSSLRAVLESGVPTIRNKIGGHGQGDVKKDAEDHLVRFTLNLTGANLVYLIEQSGIG